MKKIIYDDLVRVVINKLSDHKNYLMTVCLTYFLKNFGGK